MWLFSPSSIDDSLFHNYALGTRYLLNPNSNIPYME